LVYCDTSALAAVSSPLDAEPEPEPDPEPWALLLDDEPLLPQAAATKVMAPRQAAAIARSA
jgi:hypothetical protein